jgi:serine phosphatase RsbU (regulator of sigma subunit)
MAVVVGDVTGHGITAAADMALIRGMMSALLHSGVAPSRVFAEVSGVLAQRTAPLLATAALAIIDTDEDTVTFATAGHPPPVLRLADGKVRVLDTANGSMIGIASRPGSAETVPFPPGSQLVMFTDGLVERRDRPFFVGVEQVARHLEEVGVLSTNELVDSMLEALLGDVPAQDDVVILVVENSA